MKKHLTAIFIALITMISIGCASEPEVKKPYNMKAYLSYEAQKVVESKGLYPVKHYDEHTTYSENNYGSNIIQHALHTYIKCDNNKLAYVTVIQYWTDKDKHLEDRDQQMIQISDNFFEK